ncbi:SIR2-like protein [Luteibacter rhizovicinus]|uniref:SIR2-like protein n=1 Tax=Luteibacter rhizovicinus TaxID=242606 RepID=A0A4V2W3I6_9GAMM|nr:SIR2 family protein [Luteibacter rhizovicinus]TCV92119.1 SIR2-like protein [Luteibacter rhizovicinus]
MTLNREPLLAAHNPELEPLLRRIVNGGAMLFLGSGYSSDALGLADETLGTAGALADKIGELGGFEAGGELRYAADRYLDRGGPGPLIDLLHTRFTIKKPLDHHRQIAAAPWRRAYTTNYDLCFETAATEQGLLIRSVDLEAPPADFQAKKNVCVHINGSLKNLTSESLNNAFKLSTSSYLDANSFLDSLWAFPFNRDLELSSAIVFVGYSMYDIEVQKILHANSHYAAKTYFVTREQVSEKDIFTLSKFGKILPITAAGFGHALASAMADSDSADDDQTILASLAKYEVTELGKEARDGDVFSFLLRGEATDDLIDSAVTHVKGAPLLVTRTRLQEAVALVKSGSNIVVTADFGNGKSVFLRALRTLLAIDGLSVYSADDIDPHQHDDLERLVQSAKPGVLLVDAYEQNFDFVRHYAELSPKNITLVLGARTSNHDRMRPAVKAAGLRLHEVEIDELDSSEIEEFIKIGDSIGFWGEKTGHSDRTKFEIIWHDNHRQLSLALLSVLSSPQMIERVKGLLANLLVKPRYRDTVFAIALLSAIDSQLTSSLIREIALNDEIYESDFRNEAGFKDLFRLEGSKVKTKSSLFATSMISHQFPATYIVDQMLKIAASIGDGRGELPEKRNVQRALLRFSVVERLLPEAKRKQNLVRYYETVKRDVTWLKGDPHFWLQYGMAQITYKDYDLAQKYFDNAYSLAQKKRNYHTVQLDTQQARLYLFRATAAATASDALKAFSDAHQLLRKVPNDIHKFRQVELYGRVFEVNYPEFNGSGKATFEQACRAQLSEIDKLLNSGDVEFSGHRGTKRVRELLERILDTVKQSRSASV